MIALVLGVKYLIIVNENDVSMTTKSKIFNPVSYYTI